LPMTIVPIGGKRNRHGELFDAAPMNKSWLLYKREYVDKGFERLEVFVLLAERYGVQSVLYPGSYVHITPSFVFPAAVYADMDRRAEKFFSDSWSREFVRKNRLYPDTPVIRFHAADYTAGFDEPPQSFDLLVSQYAGFVSEHCKKYLKPGGLLLANDSHGDAGLARLDPDYRLVAVVSRRNQRVRLLETDLHEYFIPKSGERITRDHLITSGRGAGYSKAAWAYIFRLG